MDKIILQVENLCFSYEGCGKRSLDNVNLNIKRGSKVAFMGANGSGKSTLFLCLNGIHRPDSGTIYLDGIPYEYSKKGLLDIRRRVGIVFQDPDNQLFLASVYQEISFGILNTGVSVKQAREEVEQVMEQMTLTPFRDQPTHALSGGQKKQVSIADILVMHPDVIILDEPASALDPKHTRIVREIVNQLSEEGITILIATHDIDYACAWADEIVLMHEGTVLKKGTPAEICMDQETLKKTNLEEPTAVRIFQKLCQKGVLESTENIPVSMQELEKCIEHMTI